jgi:hypothetical protein
MLQAAETEVEAAREKLRPSLLLRPTLSVDGDKWCALYGANLMEGVAGFGDSPAEAYVEFDRAWTAKLDNYATRKAAAKDSL